MSKKGIEDLIKELEIFVDSCKFQPLSSVKIVVPKDELMGMIKELRMKLPSEIERCQKIMRNKDSILTEAREQRDQMIADANAEAESLIAEHEIVQYAQVRAQEVMNQAAMEADQLRAQAQAQAEEIMTQANAEAHAVLNAANEDGNTIRIGAMQYTQDALVNVEGIMQNALIEGAKRYNEMLDLIQENLEVVVSNRQEIEESLYGASVSSEQTMEMESSATGSEVKQEIAEESYHYEEEE